MREDVNKAIIEFEVKTFGNRKNIEKAETVLHDNETVLFVAGTNYTIVYKETGAQEIAPGIVFLTDERFIFCRPARNFAYKDFSLNKIIAVTHVSNGMSASQISIGTLKATYVFSVSYKEHIVQKLLQTIELVKSNYIDKYIRPTELEKAFNTLAFIDAYLDNRETLESANLKICQETQYIRDENPGGTLFEPSCNIVIEFGKVWSNEKIDRNVIITNRNVIAKELGKTTIELTEETKEIDAPTNISSANEIRKFKELLDDGIITEEEFNAKKKQLLGL